MKILSNFTQMIIQQIYLIMDVYYLHKFPFLKILLIFLHICEIQLQLSLLEFAQFLSDYENL